MTERRTDRIETPDGNTHTTTTIVTDEPRSGSGVSGWFLMFVVLLAVLVAIWVFVGSSESEIAQDDTIAEAASRVSTTAEEVGEAAAEVREAAQDVGAAAPDAVPASAVPAPAEEDPGEGSPNQPTE